MESFCGELLLRFALVLCKSSGSGGMWPLLKKKVSYVGGKHLEAESLIARTLFFLVFSLLDAFTWWSHLLGGGGRMGVLIGVEADRIRSWLNDTSLQEVVAWKKERFLSKNIIRWAGGNRLLLTLHPRSTLKVPFGVPWHPRAKQSPTANVFPSYIPK